MNVNWDELKNFVRTPVAAIAAGVIILIWPDLLAYLVAVALIVYGGLALAQKS